MDKYSGKEAYLFLKNLGVKIGQTKVYKDIADGNLPCTTDKKILHSDLLNYAESLKPREGGLSEVEQLRRSRQALTELVRKILPHVVMSSSLESKLHTWLTEIEELQLTTILESTSSTVQTSLNAQRVSTPSSAKLKRAELLLQGIALGILAKGKIYRKDSLFLARWIRNHSSLWGKPVIKTLQQEADRLNLVVSEDFNDRTAPLHEKISNFVVSSGLQIPDVKIKGEKWRGNNNPVVLISATDDLFDSISEMNFSANFCFTGTFVFGTREQCEQSVVQLGGVIKSKPIQGGKNYLVVGSASNPRWNNIRSGTKIDDAVYYRQLGHDMTIVHEDVWTDCLLKAQRQRGLIPPAPIPSGQFRPPWPLESVFFLIPPPDMPKIYDILHEEQVQVATDCHRRVDAIVMPSDLWAATEEELANIPDVGEQKAAEIAVARDSGVLIIGEEEFRQWIWWREKGQNFVEPCAPS